MTQSINNQTPNHDDFDVTNPLKDWDGVIYTFCYHSKEELSNGFYPTYCIESWGKDNTVMLMEMFKDYNYNIQCRKHDYTPDTNNN